jgi:hypothetical protein
MNKFITLSKLLVVSIVISLSTIFIGGFPVFYYLPAADDYGASFYESEFLINTALIFFGALIFYFLFKKFRS